MRLTNARVLQLGLNTSWLGSGGFCVFLLGVGLLNGFIAHISSLYSTDSGVLSVEMIWQVYATHHSSIPDLDLDSDPGSDPDPDPDLDPDSDLDSNLGIR
jgi:hypothetical protein